MDFKEFQEIVLEQLKEKGKYKVAESSCKETSSGQDYIWIFSASGGPDNEMKIKLSDCYDYYQEVMDINKVMDKISEALDKKPLKPDQKENIDDDRLSVLLVEPRSYPKRTEIRKDFEDMHKLVGGYIEALYPFEDPVCIICNEDGKIKGLELNRSLRDEDGEIYDILAGNFLIVGLTDEGFCSLTKGQKKHFEELFHQPEIFVRMGSGIMSLPMPDEMVDCEKEKKRPYREEVRFSAGRD